MNEDNSNKAMSEVREWLVKIDTKQENILQLLEDSKARANEAYTKADNAEDSAEEALRAIESHRQDYHKRIDKEDNDTKFAVKTGVTVIGILVTLIIFLTPIIIGYYVP